MIKKIKLKETIKKYYWLFFLNLLTLLIVSIIKNGTELGIFFKFVLFTILAPLVGAIFIAIIEKIFSNSYLKLNQELATLFNAEIKFNNLSKTRIGKYDIYIYINKNTNAPIEFHIPRKQINKMKHKPKFEYRNSNLNLSFNSNKLKTYLVYSSGGFCLKRDKMKIEKLINEVSRYK